MREEGADPGAVDEVARAPEGGEEEEVEEDALEISVSRVTKCRGGRKKDLHLWVEKACIRLNNADSLVKGLNGIKGSIAIGNHGGQIQFEILRV